MPPQTKKRWKYFLLAVVVFIGAFWICDWITIITNKNRYLPKTVIRERTAYTSSGNLVVNEEELFIVDTVSGKVKRIPTQDYVYFKDFK